MLRMTLRNLLSLPPPFEDTLERRRRPAGAKAGESEQAQEIVERWDVIRRRGHVPPAQSGSIRIRSPSISTKRSARSSARSSTDMPPIQLVKFSLCIYED